MPMEDSKRELYQAADEMRNAMVHELLANRRKGDREGWLACSPMMLVLEVFHHAAKLHRMVTERDRAEKHDPAFANSPAMISAIREYAADTANMAMMVLDRCGGLLPLPKGDLDSVLAATGRPVTPMPNTRWTQAIIEKEK